MRTLVIALTLLSSSMSFAQDDPRKKLVPAAKGRKAPDFTAIDEKGKVFKLSQFMKKADKNVVLVFSRGGF